MDFFFIHSFYISLRRSVYVYFISFINHTGPWNPRFRCMCIYVYISLLYFTSNPNPQGSAPKNNNNKSDQKKIYFWGVFFNDQSVKS